MDRDDLLADIDEGTLGPADRELYDAVAEGIAPPVVPVRLRRETIRRQLVFLPGTKVDIGGGEKHVADLVGEGADGFIANRLKLVANKTPQDKNNLACVLLHLDKQAGWDQATALLKEASDELKTKPRVRATVERNLTLANRLRMIVQLGSGDANL